MFSEWLARTGLDSEIKHKKQSLCFNGGCTLKEGGFRTINTCIIYNIYIIYYVYIIFHVYIVYLCLYKYNI